MPMTSARGRALRFRQSLSDEWPYYLVLLALPALSLATYGYILFQSGYIDPWVYTGLIYKYDEVVDRLGPTYYAARIAHIFPDAFLEHLLGDQAGFYAYRDLMRGELLRARKNQGKKSSIAGSIVISVILLLAIGAVIMHNSGLIQLQK